METCTSQTVIPEPTPWLTESNSEIQVHATPPRKVLCTTIHQPGPDKVDGSRDTIRLVTVWGAACAASHVFGMRDRIRRRRPIFPRGSHVGSRGEASSSTSIFVAVTRVWDFSWNYSAGTVLSGKMAVLRTVYLSPSPISFSS